ncbi:MAG: response regulator [Anaerolineae bacterium]|nr:response regulator [Anaerolineae bacterium]
MATLLTHTPLDYPGPTPKKLPDAPYILSLDSETDILTLLHTILERAGYQHYGTTDPEEALEILRSGAVDLFTQNIVRRRMDGCEFYQIMQSEKVLRDIPVLLISSVDPATLSESSFKLVADLYPHNYIPMPFGHQRLLAAVAAIVTPPRMVKLTPK